MDLTHILFGGDAITRSRYFRIEDWVAEHVDELPYTYHDYLNSPEVKQAKAFVAYQILQANLQAEQAKVMVGSTPKQRKKFMKEYAHAMRQQQLETQAAS